MDQKHSEISIHYTASPHSLGSTALTYVMPDIMLHVHVLDESIKKVDASRREKKKLKSSRDKNARHEPQWVWGEKSLLCDPGS